MQSYFEKQQKLRGNIALIVTLLLLGIPFVSYQDLHLFMFNFYDGRFEFLFHAYEASIATLIIVFFLFAGGIIVVANLFLSRAFCGKVCPKTLLRNFFLEIIEVKILKILRMKNRQSEHNLEKKKFKTLIAYLILAGVVFVGSIPIFFYFIPYDTLLFGLVHSFEEFRWIVYLWFVSAVYLYAEILFFKDFFCSYLCPYQLVNTITYNKHRGYFKFVNQDACLECDACVKVCPVPDLDIKKGYDVRCISCGDCSAVCQDMVMQEQIEESLLLYRDSDNNDKSFWFGFGSKKLSLILSGVVAVLFIATVFYLLQEVRIESCLFSNAFLYETKD